MMEAGTLRGLVRTEGVCAWILVLLVAGGHGDAEAQSLHGGDAAMEAQNQRAATTTTRS